MAEEPKQEVTPQPASPKPVAPPPPPPEAGEFGKFLEGNKINSKPEGKDKSNIETLEIEVKDLIRTCEILKDSKETNFNLLNLITTTDLKRGYQSTYLLHSLSTKKSLRIKVTLPKENPILPTVSHLWRTADWYEREAFDMMGIIYTGHPNLKRILNPDNWEGYPLRKDYIPPSDSLNGPHPLTETEYAERTLSH